MEWTEGEGYKRFMTRQHVDLGRGKWICPSTRYFEEYSDLGDDRSRRILEKLIGTLCNKCGSSGMLSLLLVIINITISAFSSGQSG